MDDDDDVSENDDDFFRYNYVFCTICNWVILIGNNYGRIDTCRLENSSKPSKFGICCVTIFDQVSFK